MAKPSCSQKAAVIGPSALKRPLRRGSRHKADEMRQKGDVTVTGGINTRSLVELQTIAEDK